jgi:hypothetical protein
MAEPVVPEPSPAARALLRALREHESPSPAVRDEGLVALQARLQAAEPTSAANGRSYPLVKATLVTVAVAAAVLLAIKGVGAGVAALADQARQPGMAAPYQGEPSADGGPAVARAPQGVPARRPVQTTRDAQAIAEPHATTEATALDDAAQELAETAPQATAEPPRAELVDPPAREPSPAAARSPRPRSAAAGYSADDLEAELSLIKRATAAKKSGRHADGLAALREHAERFPRGLMADERTVLKAELVCAAGRVREAEALVDQFLRERAGSALAGRMRNVCRE